MAVLVPGRTKVLAASHGLNVILGVVSIRDDRRFKQTVEAVERLVPDTADLVAVW